jgi:hypothetical protein
MAEGGNVKFMLLMYTDVEESKAMTADELATVEGKHEGLRRGLTESKELLNGAGLVYPEETTTLRLVDGEPVASHGPRADADLNMSAYYVVECASADRAIAIAAGLLDFHVRAVEVRGIHNSNGMAHQTAELSG